jgi:hypothetical protein
MKDDRQPVKAAGNPHFVPHFPHLVRDSTLSKCYSPVCQ